jgi:hypothetical protein
MKIYFAGWDTSKGCLYEKEQNKVVNVLSSYYYIKNKSGLLNSWFSENKNIFLDSGAFSAFTKKAEINIDEYINFIKNNISFLEIYANLDSIGDAEKTLKNQKYMESKDLNPLPCFHYGEDFKYLDYYCKKYKYVALGGIAGANVGINDKKRWLDIIFSKYLKNKFHGFGVTNINFLFKYPWYSVDSTSWVKGDQFGVAILPNGQILNGSRKSRLSNNISMILKKYYPQIDINKFFNDYKYRNGINVLSFLKIEEELSKKQIKFKNKQKTLF